MKDTHFDPQEFKDANEAFKAIANADRVGVFGFTTQNRSAISIHNKGIRAGYWLMAAANYGLANGWVESCIPSNNP